MFHYTKPHEINVYQDSQELGFKATNKTPFVWLSNKGFLYFHGRIIPEDVSLFFDPISCWINSYIKYNNPSTLFIIHVEYIIDASKYLLQIIKLLGRNCENLRIIWIYEEYDSDILELGQLLSECSGVNFEIVTEEVYQELELSF